MKLREKLIALSVLKQGDWMSMQQVLIKDISLCSLTAENVRGALERVKGIEVLTVLDSEYPEALREMEMHPFVLFYEGDVQLLKRTKIGMVGSKKPSEYSTQSCQAMVNRLMESNRVLLSGLQLGIETVAYNEAMKQGGCIAVLASGFRWIYPRENYGLYSKLAKRHLVLSEYPPDVPPLGRQYYRSYRLIHYLSDVMLVVEGAMADKRLEYTGQLAQDGKEIFVLPDRWDMNRSKGGLMLLNKGARCLINGEEVLKALNG